MKKEIEKLIKEYERNLKDMAGANNECRENYGRDIFSEDHINTVKAFLYDLHELKNKLEDTGLDYILEIVDNTYRNADDVYSMTDSEAMNALRNRFKNEVQHD